MHVLIAVSVISGLIVLTCAIKLACYKPPADIPGDVPPDTPPDRPGDDWSEQDIDDFTEYFGEFGEF